MNNNSKSQCKFTSSVGKYNPELKIYFPGIDTPTTNEGVRVSDVFGGKIREKKSLLPQANFFIFGQIISLQDLTN